MLLSEMMGMKALRRVLTREEWRMVDAEHYCDVTLCADALLLPCNSEAWDDVDLRVKDSPRHDENSPR